MSFLPRGLLMTLVVVAMTGPALAQAPATLAAPAPPAPRAEDFLKGTWSLSLYGGYVHDFQHDQDLGLGSVAVGYYLYDHVAFGAEVRGLGVSQDGPDAAAVAGDLFVRQHLISCDPWTLYIDASVGVFQADHDVPPGGTHFNFMEDTGVGATYRLEDGVYLMGGARYFHLSNARIHGADRNPSINGIEGYFGVMFTL